jgi:hypothetical protein
LRIAVNQLSAQIGAPALLSASVSTDRRLALDANKSPVSTAKTPVVKPNINISSAISLVYDLLKDKVAASLESYGLVYKLTWYKSLEIAVHHFLHV